MLLLLLLLLLLLFNYDYVMYLYCMHGDAVLLYVILIINDFK